VSRSFPNLIGRGAKESCQGANPTTDGKEGTGANCALVVASISFFPANSAIFPASISGGVADSALVADNSAVVPTDSAIVAANSALVPASREGAGTSKERVSAGSERVGTPWISVNGFSNQVRKTANRKGQNVTLVCGAGSNLGYRVAGCLLLTGAFALDGSAQTPLRPSLPPRDLMGAKKTPSQARARAGVKAATVSRLGRNPKPRRPSLVSKTGKRNPDARGIGLADERLRADASARVTTLEDAIALALANNPQRAEAQAAVDAATANIGVVQSGGKLQVGASGQTQYGRNTTISNGLANAGASRTGETGTGTTGTGAGSNSGTGGNMGTGGTTTSAGPSRSFLRFDQLQVDANLPLYTGGRVKASTRQARYQAVAQIYALAQAEQTLVLNTTLGYLDVLRAGQLLRVTNANLSVSQERLRVARLRFSVGASPRLAVLQAQTDLADARTRRINAVNALGTSNAVLNVLLGRAPESPIRLATITRLSLPNIAYGVSPNSVLTPAQRAASPTTRTGSATTGTGQATGLYPSGTGTSPSSSGVLSSGSSPSLPNAGGAASSGGTAGTGGTLNTPNTVTSPSATTSTGTTGAGATTLGTGTTSATTATTTPGAIGTTNSSAGVGSTATSSSSGSTGALNTGAVSGGASTGLQVLAGSTQQSLAVTQAQIGAAQEAIKIAQSNRRPQLGATLSGLLRNPATFLGNFGASIGLGLSQDLFDSNRTRDQVRVARAALTQLQARLAGQRLQVAQAIETSLLSLDSSQRRQNNAETGVVSASEALRVAQIGFRSGVSTTLDVANAQASLLSAQTDAVNARFDVADSQATLAAAIGIYTTEEQAARARALRAQQDAEAQAQKQRALLHPKPKKKRRRFLGIF